MLSQRAILQLEARLDGEKSAELDLVQTRSQFESILSAQSRFHLDDRRPEDIESLQRLTEKWGTLKRAIDAAQADYLQQGKVQNTARLMMLGNAVLDEAEGNVNRLLPRFDQTRNTIRLLLPISILLELIFFYHFYRYIRRRLIKPLKSLDQMLLQLGEGNLAARVHIDHPDEMGRLLARANDAGDQLLTAHKNETTALEGLYDSEVRNRTLWEISSAAIVIMDVQGKIHFANPAVKAVFGYLPEELVGQNIAVIQPEELRTAHLNGMKRYVETGVQKLNWSCIEVGALRKDGRELQVELAFSHMRLSNVEWFCGTFRDITDRKRQQEALNKAANFDSLSGLPNRVLLHDRIDQELLSAKRYGRSFGVLYIDLDNFKIVNDTLGHEAGDALLREAAPRLLRCVRDVDTIARVGGDEFVVLVSDLSRESDLDAVAQRALTELARPFHVHGHEFFVGASIGSAVFPRDGDSRDTILKCADIAMYRAKEQGRNNFQHYAEHMQERYKLRLGIESHLRKAIANQEFVLHYQPQIEIESGRVIGAEALIRWDSPSLGRVSPNQFIPLAEETGLIVSIGAWVIDRAIQDVKTWSVGAAGQECTVAINLSARQFKDASLIDSIRGALTKHEVEGRQVEFEITESLIMDSPQMATDTMTELRDIGCHLAIDDFGTGYSSLSYLKTFPVSRLKIDKSLINDKAIVRAVTQLSKSFGLYTIAEGVEDEKSLSLLRQMDCDIVQGFYYAKPMPLTEFMAFLSNPTVLASGAKIGPYESSHDAH